MVAVPLISKGRGEIDGSNLDMNYFLGIRSTDSVLVADFENAASGGNHPVAGTTPIGSHTWYHAAATYDGTTWRLYLNGNLEATLAVNQTPRSDSIQHAAIASALNSTGAAEGWFDGVIDEVRVWDHARSQAAIQADMDHPLASASGLRARWGFDQGSGSMLLDSSGSGIHGTVQGGTWVAGAPFASGPAPLLDYALDHNGSSNYVTFGPAPALGAAEFTHEVWFNRQGAGATASTGTGGVDAVPLLTKGPGEADGSNLDMNYFLGIRGTDCPSEFNPDQRDADRDGVGDVCARCEPPPEVARDLRFADPATLVWSASAAAASYAAYRGTIDGGAWNADAACLEPALASPSLSDAALPGRGTAFFYLVSGRNACGEGALGSDSAGNLRPNPAPCP